MIRPHRDDTCPMTNAPCRHCSIEKASGAVTLLKPDIHSGLLVRKADSFNVMELGARCNNDGKRWVEDLKVCPATLHPTKPWAPWKPAPVKKKWRVARGTPVVERQVPVSCGQQRLRV